jgi:hypothetical protein
MELAADMAVYGLRGWFLHLPSSVLPLPLPFVYPALSHLFANELNRTLTLLPQLGLSLLHTRNHHIAHTRIGQPVQARTEPIRLNQEERLCA